ncbi:hypothetical protein [Mesorhizobium sp. Z1-4]|uniref:hypothetical protein n=1 Tax=Mesorhizobium sp. Z1-4 TaxID=2448478 RepID=UPI000FDAF9F5|nr:hypothetical protein [Mesorhizobium sp. Z1-4]
MTKLNQAIADKMEDIGTATSSDIMLFLDASDDYTLKYGDAANTLQQAGITSSAAELNILDGVTATAAEINGAADVSGRYVAIADADYAVLAANSGKTHVIANVSADRTITLPAAAAGLEYVFMAAVGAADGHDWIFVAGDTSDLFYGGLLSVDTDAGPATVALVAADQSDDDQLQVNLPQGGTCIRMISDGSFWYVSGTVISAEAPVFS